MGKRIAFVIGGMTRGGAERVISILANEYAKNGWQADIVMLLTDKVDYDIDKRISIIDLVGKSRKNIISIIGWLKSFRHYVKKAEPDVIVSFVARINIITLLSTLGLRSRIVVSERNDPTLDGRSKLVDWCTKILYKRADRVVFQTNRARDYFASSIKKNSVIIPNPICVEQEVSGNSKHKIVSVGRLAPQKNQKMLIDAFYAVRKLHPEYSLWIYGEGELRNELEDHIRKLGLKDSVFLPGNMKHIHVNIADADMFVLSSNYEGLSNALLEAMMMGLPCISTNCAGSDEYIKDGLSGLLVPVGDTTEMATAILKLIEDRDLRERIIDNSAQSVDNCRVEKVMQSWQNTIEGNLI